MASLRLEPKHLGVQTSERFPGRHLLDRMQAADPGNIRMPYHLAGLAIQLDHPTGRARGLVEFLQTCPQHVSYEFERIDPSKMGNLTQELAIEVELMKLSLLRGGIRKAFATSGFRPVAEEWPVILSHAIRGERPAAVHAVL